MKLRNQSCQLILGHYNFLSAKVASLLADAFVSTRRYVRLCGLIRSSLRVETLSIRLPMPRKLGRD